MDEIAVILPALNEEQCVEIVVKGFRDQGVRVIVVDNGSTDRTNETARRAGAHVVVENTRGYGNACLAGLRYLTQNPPNVVVFADCDGTLNPSEIKSLVSPILAEDADVALGRRSRVEAGALPAHQRYGNRVACFLLKTLYGVEINDIPPYRALRWSFIAQLPLSEGTYGLPIETIAMAARRRARIVEIDVDYRVRRGGKSKVTSSLWSSLQAGWTMLGLVAVIRLRT